MMFEVVCVPYHVIVLLTVCGALPTTVQLVSFEHACDLNTFKAIPEDFVFLLDPDCVISLAEQSRQLCKLHRESTSCQANAVLGFALEPINFESCCPAVKFTFVLDDPLSNCFIYNPNAPEDDPQIEVEVYERTWEQNEELGINDMNV